MPDDASTRDAGARDANARLGRIGDNGGPPLEPEEDAGTLSWRSWAWRRAHKKVWASPGREIVMRRLARAEELGMTYKEYTLEILERGRYL